MMYWIFCFFSVLFSGNLLAGDPLTLRTCFAIALDQNPRERAAEENVLAYKEEVLFSYAPYYPSLIAYADYLRFRDFIFLPTILGANGQPIVIPNIIGPTNDWIFNVQSRWTLFDSGLRRARLLKAMSNKNIAKNQREQITQAILLQVAESFFDFLRATHLRDVARHQLGRAEDHVRISESQSRVGAAPPLDVFRTKTDLSQARLSLYQSEANLKIAQGTLNVAMGLSPETQLELAEEEGLDINVDAINLNEALDNAYCYRPEVDEKLNQIAVVEETIREIKSEYGPTISASGLYGKHDADFFPKVTQWNVGVSIEMPLFEGFKTNHNLKKARHQLNQAVAEHEEIALLVRQDVWNAHARLVQNKKAIYSTQVSETYAKEAHRLAKKRYEVSAGTLNDLLDAETSLFQAEQDVVNSQFSFYSSYAQFLWSAGIITCFLED